MEPKNFPDSQPFATPPHPASVESSLEKEKFIEKFFQQLRDGQVGFGFFGKVKNNFNVQGVNFSHEGGGYHHHLVGNFELSEADQRRVMEGLPRLETVHNKDFTADELVTISQVGRDETNLKSLRLERLLSGGGPNIAYAVVLSKKAKGADVVGRSYTNYYCFIGDGRLVNELLEEAELLKRYPDILVRIMERLSPELLRDGGFIKGQSRRVVLLREIMVEHLSQYDRAGQELERRIIDQAKSEEKDGRTLEYML